MPLAGGVAISEKAATSLTEALAAETQNQGEMEVVVLPRVTGTLLSPLKPREVVSCSTDRCMAEVAAAFGSERLLGGEVSWDGANLVLTLQLLEARSARILAIAERRIKKGTLNDLLGALPSMVTELLRAPPAPREIAAPVAPPQPRSERAPALAQPPREPDRRPSTSLGQEYR
jgi:hypothetical protein